MPSVAKENMPESFRHETLAHELAHSLAGGAGNAEQLIDATQLQYSRELAAAQLLGHDADRTKAVDRADIAKAMDIPEEKVVSHSVRGGYVIYAFELPDGRIYKDAALIDSEGKITAAERPDTPERQALRAAVEAHGKVQEAQSEAERIVADAKRKAAEMIAEAAQKARGEQAAAALRVQEEHSQRLAEDEGDEPFVSDQVAGGSAEQSETAGEKATRRGKDARKTG